jgi:hypothetical protein
MCLEDDTGHIKSASARFPRGAGAVSFGLAERNGCSAPGWKTSQTGRILAAWSRRPIKSFCLKLTLLNVT